MKRTRGFGVFEVALVTFVSMALVAALAPCDAHLREELSFKVNLPHGTIYVGDLVPLSLKLSRPVDEPLVAVITLLDDEVRRSGQEVRGREWRVDFRVPLWAWLWSEGLSNSGSLIGGDEPALGMLDAAQEEETSLRLCVKLFHGEPDSTGGIVAGTRIGERCGTVKVDCRGCMPVR